jgi:multicomponent Na+:H+ antiporter subunit E
MDTRKPGNPYRDLAHILVNALIAAGGAQLVTIFGPSWDYMLDYMLFFAIGIAVITLYDRRYAPWLFWLVVFIVYLLWEILLSAIHLSWIILQPNPKLDPGIVAVPLTVSTDLEIIALATSINLTPGSICIDIGYDETGQRVAYVQAFSITDREEFQNSIKNGFERLILNISRGL